MKTLKPLLLSIVLFCYVAASAQVQWYQNQDAQNPFGTFGTSIKKYNQTTFIASYLWASNGDDNTWKISKSNISGTELQTFFLTSGYSTVEFKISGGFIYVFERGFTPDFQTQFRLFKLDGNLVLRAQQTIQLPNGFAIYNANSFETDDASNVYLAGDGQYPDNGGGYLPASFVWKMDKNLSTKWTRIDSLQTSYRRLHITHQGKIMVIAEHFDFFPEVHITKLSSNGAFMGMKTVNTDPMHYSLFTMMDKNDDLFIYGGKSIGDTAQGIYLMKVEGFTNQAVVYDRTLFTAAGTQLNDLQIDDQCRLFALVSQNTSSGEQLCKIASIKPGNGSIFWTRTMHFSNDSCNLVKLAIDPDDRIYALGERRANNYFSKGFAVKLRKHNGHILDEYIAPDSVAFQRSHWLSDGFIDQYDKLIAIGTTTDLDTLTFTNSYFRAFAVRFNETGITSKGGGEDSGIEESNEGSLTVHQFPTKLLAYPNPTNEVLIVSNINPEEFNQVSIYNLQGARIQQMSVGGTSARFNTHGLANGMYLVVLESTLTKNTKTLKFVVKH